MSKKESKSQHVCIYPVSIKSCYKYRNVKERKQITTCLFHAITPNVLLQISQCQRKKANHNTTPDGVIDAPAATNIAMSKKESKSQQERKMKRYKSRCYKYRNVKERKQITTCSYFAFINNELLQISQCQRKKANHNVAKIVNICS